MSNNRNRWFGALAGLALSAGLVAVVQTTAQTAAWAVSGLEVVHRLSTIDSVSPKSATARCPSGKHVIGGGGGLVWTAQLHSREVVLTRMEPVHSDDGSFRDYFVVTGVETSVGEPDNWYLESFAICANPMPGYEIVEDRSITLSDMFIRTEAHCDDDRVVIGTGAALSTNSGEVGLQVMRASMLETFSYAQAAEDYNGYFDYWNVTAFAVCVDEPDGYDIVQQPSLYDDSEDEKLAWAVCPPGTRVHGAGFSTAFGAPGHVAMTHTIINPYGQQRVDAVAAEVTLTDYDWDFIIAQAICAT
jgi:hypothetical protein